MDERNKMNDNNLTPENDEAYEYEGMSKSKAALIKVLPLTITLACVGLFAWGVKAIAGVFYAPDDSCHTRELNGSKMSIVWCEQQGSNTYYVYGEDFVYDAAELDNAGSEHTDAHHKHKPLVYFTLNEDPLDIDSMAFNILVDGNGLYALQLDEFVVYRLEGQYGVIAPLREFKQSATSRKNDLYVIKQLLKNERYNAFVLPEGTAYEDFAEILEKLEWQLDTEYAEDEN